ncbi:MAG: hypothetical protein ABI461_13730 [Polyangiaceae bacterium]
MRIDAISRSAPIGARTFDVICAGVPSFDIHSDGARTRIGGGAIRAASALVRQDLRVGLATVLQDDSVGRTVVDKLESAGIDVGGVCFSSPTSSVFFVRGGALQTLHEGKEDAPISIPEGWSSQVLLLSGMSPVVSHGAALCKAARAARRAGSTVIVDLHADWNLWRGRDWRSTRMILREADVVWASGEDLLGLDLDVPSLRAAMRPNAVLATHTLGCTSAFGSFGAVTHPSKLGPTDRDDDLVAAICFELKHAKNNGENDASLWTRALARGHAKSRPR